MWYHYDRLGNVMDLTEQYGGITASCEQDAFGNVLQENSAGYHLTSKEFSHSIALYYFYQRWYEPQIGRFIQKDYYHFLNRYIYCENNPVNNADPLGLFTFDDSCKCLSKLGPGQPSPGNKTGDAKGECFAQAEKIQDPKIRDCVTEKCDRGHINCGNDPKMCNPQPPDYKRSPLGRGQKGANSIYLCIDNILNNHLTIQQLWDVIIHEFAHTCGWQHGDDKGVPGDS